MKFSISNIAWSVEHDNEMYQYLQEVGFTGLEIAPTRIYAENPYDKLKEAKEWATQLRERFGLEIPSMQSIWYGHQEKIFGNQEERRVLIDYTKKAIDFAEVICCKNLVFGNPKNRDTDDIQNNYPIAIDFFKEIGDYAVEHNTIIAIEANPTIYNTRFINKTEQAVDMVCSCDSKGIKVNVDLGTIIYNNEDIEYLKQVPEYINHVHISEPGLNFIERRDIHSNLIHVLQDINYKGYLSIEMGNKGEIGAVKEVIRYIISLL